MLTNLFQGVSDGLCIAGLKVYDTFGSKPSYSQTRSIKSSEASIQQYAAKESRPMVSNKETLYEDPKLNEYLADKSAKERLNIGCRAAAGFFIACHVFAYLSGKEGLHSDEWLIERKQCANMICKHLTGMEMYHGVETDLGPKDYFIDSKDKNRPVLTKNIIREAFRRFPVEYFESKFTDDNIDVIDIEEQVINAARKKEGEKPDAKPGEIIIDVDPKDIREVKPGEDAEESVEEDEDKPKENLGQSPIFDYSKMNLAPETDVKEVTPTQAKMIGDLFGKYVQGKAYQLNRFPTGAIEMVISDGKNGTYQYWIDPNLCIGNGYNVIARIPIPGKEDQFDTIMVHESEDEILAKVFNNRQYLLTPDEVQKCMTHMFANQGIYHWVDMSNMQKRLEKLSADEFRKLGQKLTFIINALEPEEKGRMRISAWKGIDKFTLTSDSKTKIPFIGVCNDKLTGVTVSVDGDNVTINHVDKNKAATTVPIEDYGVL